jgi:hypothetical protein
MKATKRITFHIIIIVVIAVLTSCMNTKPYSVNQDEYLGNNKNSSNIYYKKQAEYFYSHFNMDIYPIYKLMLIDFKGDSKY